MSHAPQSYLDIMDHIQEQWECRHAAEIYSEKLRKDTPFLPNEDVFNNHDNYEEATSDLAWQDGQEDVGGQGDGGQHDREDEFFIDDDAGEGSSLLTRTVISLATQANLYATLSAPSKHYQEVQDVGMTGRTISHSAASYIANAKAVFIDNRRSK